MGVQSISATTRPGAAPLPRFGWRAVGLVVAVQAPVLTALSGQYGFHRDELYFLAAGHHPAWGYVDQPPLTPMLARLALGDSPAGLRVYATLIAAAAVVVLALVAREFGGGSGAQAFTAAATALSTYVLAVTHMVSTNTVDLLVWALTGLLVVRATRDGRWWLAVGGVVGVGLLNKWLVLLLLAAMGLAMVAAGPRRPLRSGWLVAGSGLALLVVAPNLVWQAAHGWPQFTVASGISGQDGTANRVMFVPAQLLYVSPVLVPVMVAGFGRLWRDPALRWLALAYPILCAETLLLGGKPYYAIPLLLLLVAAGAEPASRWLRSRMWIGWAVVGTVISVLIGLPVVPAAHLGPVLAINPEAGEQYGWPRFVDAVAAGWRQIPSTQRGTAVVFTANYGEAGAIQRYGPARGLPRPYSGHMSYGDWGPPPAAMTGPVLLVMQKDDTPGPAFTGCRQVARNDNRAGVDNQEQGARIELCQLTGTWARLWPGLRHYY